MGESFIIGFVVGAIVMFFIMGGGVVWLRRKMREEMKVGKKKEEG